MSKSNFSNSNVNSDGKVPLRSCKLPVDIVFHTCPSFLTRIVIFRGHVDNGPSFWQGSLTAWLWHGYDTPFWHAKICNLKRTEQLFWKPDLSVTLVTNSWNTPERTGCLQSLTWHKVCGCFRDRKHQLHFTKHSQFMTHIIPTALPYPVVLLRTVLMLSGWGMRCGSLSQITSLHGTQAAKSLSISRSLIV